jgi:hypothetical protein
VNESGVSTAEADSHLEERTGGTATLMTGAARACYGGRVQTWTYPAHHPPGDGPWRDEPDKVQWVDEATDLDCLVVRNHSGALCGYVGVPPGHPWHGVDYSSIEPFPGVHGELTFSDFCREGVDHETEAAICHVPEPGRPDHVWWIGFDCAHAWDLVPRYDQMPLGNGKTVADALIEHMTPRPTYRDLDFVMTECRSLAAQVQTASLTV